MSRIVQHITFAQQQCGPIQNITVFIATKNLIYPEQNIGQVSRTFTVDEKVNVFFKSSFRWSELILSVNIQKKKSVRNCNVEITCQKFRKVISCYKECIEVQLNPIKSEKGYDYAERYYDNRSHCDLFRYFWQYFIEVNITVHEMMSIHNELYEDTEFTDFQLKAADGAVAVHKSILTFQSDVFKTMLKGEWKETVEGCINIDGVTRETLQHLKDYMYLGTLPDEGWEPLLSIFHVFDNVNVNTR